MALNGRASSRFSGSDPILNRDGKETFGIAKKFDFLDRDILQEGEIKTLVVDIDGAGRPDQLAEKIYGNVDLGWILIQFNHIENPFNWPLNGQVIEFPDPSVVFSEI
jgi:hypothetical protein